MLEWLAGYRLGQTLGRAGMHFNLEIAVQRYLESRSVQPT